MDTQIAHVTVGRRTQGPPVRKQAMRMRPHRTYKHVAAHMHPCISRTRKRRRIATATTTAIVAAVLPRRRSRRTTSPTHPRRPSSIKFAGISIILGLLGTGDNLMLTYGIRYIPVSTFSLLSSTNLAFNAVFAYFLNSQKFTPYIFNSVLILTLAAILLAVHSDGGSASSKNYPLGLTLTLAASALAGFILSLTQLTIQKILKAKTMAIVLEMMLWTGVVTTLACIVGLFASGQWRGVHEEFMGFDRGRVSYLMTLIWIGVRWLVASVGFWG
ncbi:putative purine permease 11 [Platanthera zijinensis]|uniref:Purine permease 11 n=1 Tax=Platanthera zijinensis TaxID=2320716 RepID=A0AAP0GFN8_9ASPA